MAPDKEQCKFLRTMEKQFLSCYPLKLISWHLLEVFSF